MIVFLQSSEIVFFLRQAATLFVNFWSMIVPVSLRILVVMFSGHGALPFFIVLIAFSVNVVRGKVPVSCSNC